jgi:hypothetical protein
MGLHVYVGSLTRYYTGDWETTVQRLGREHGVPVRVVRPGETPGLTQRLFGALARLFGDSEPATPPPDPAQVRQTVVEWRERIAASQPAMTSMLAWNEEATVPYFTDKPDWHGYSSLLLWAAYEEHPDLVRPETATSDWSNDPAFQRSTRKDSGTRYPHLVLPRWWLPTDFAAVFTAQDLRGNEVVFGSAARLLAELEELNRRTWRAADAALDRWRGEAEPTNLEQGARHAFAIFRDLARKALEHRLVMKLDY